eukprot:XP_001703191.1 predicted protein [Chlamydomonas reinhardtii]
MPNEAGGTRSYARTRIWWTAPLHVCSSGVMPQPPVAFQARVLRGVVHMPAFVCVTLVCTRMPAAVRRCVPCLRVIAQPFVLAVAASTLPSGPVNTSRGQGCGTRHPGVTTTCVELLITVF